MQGSRLTRLVNDSFCIAVCIGEEKDLLLECRIMLENVPYVLVLIDGNGYIFNDELIRDKEEGGVRATCSSEGYLPKSLCQICTYRIR